MYYSNQALHLCLLLDSWRILYRVWERFKILDLVLYKVLYKTLSIRESDTPISHWVATDRPPGQFFLVQYHVLVRKYEVVTVV